MTPRLGLSVARFGFVIMVLCAAGTAITQITYVEGPPENNWGDNMLEMCMLPLFWLSVAIEEETNFTLMGILLLHAGGFLGLTVMAVGLAMASAFVKGNSSRIGLCVAFVGLLIAVLCALHVVMLDMGIHRLVDEPFGGWRSDAAAVRQALCLLGGFVGLNLVVVGLVTAGVLALTWPLMPRQGLYIALAGLVIIVLCVEAGLLLPDVVFSIIALYLGGFVGLVAIVVGLILAAVGVVTRHLPAVVSRHG